MEVVSDLPLEVVSDLPSEVDSSGLKYKIMDNIIKIIYDRNIIPNLIFMGVSDVFLADITENLAEFILDTFPDCDKSLVAKYLYGIEPDADEDEVLEIVNRHR